MGRRPLGRKYPKHISIQVKNEHNDDLKAMTDRLNEIAELSNQKWTIRDVILTLLYGSINYDADWFVNNHFEKISSKQLTVLRKRIHDTTKNRPRKKQLRLVIDPEYQQYIDKVKEFSTTLGDES